MGYSLFLIVLFRHDSSDPSEFLTYAFPVFSVLSNSLLKMRMPSSIFDTLISNDEKDGVLLLIPLEFI